MPDETRPYSLRNSESWVFVTFRDNELYDFVEDFLTERRDGLEPVGVRHLGSAFELYFDQSVNLRALADAIDAACIEFGRG